MSHTKINHKFNSEMKKLSWRMKWAGFLLNNFISSDIIYFCYYFNKQLNIFSLLISVKVRKFNLFNSSIFPFYWWVIFGVGAQRLTHQLLTRPDLIRNFWLPEKVENIFRENLQSFYFSLVTGIVTGQILPDFWFGPVEVKFARKLPFTHV